MKVKSLSHVRPFATPRTAAYQAPPSMGFSRQAYWSGLPLSSPKGPDTGQKLELVDTGQKLELADQLFFLSVVRTISDKNTDSHFSWKIMGRSDRNRCFHQATFSWSGKTLWSLQLTLTYFIHFLLSLQDFDLLCAAL